MPTNFEDVKSRRRPNQDLCIVVNDRKIVLVRKMRDKEVRRMLILSKDKPLVGVVSLGDLSKVEEKESGKTLKEITEAA